MVENNNFTFLHACSFFFPRLTRNLWLSNCLMAQVDKEDLKNKLASLGFQGDVSDEQAAELMTLLDQLEGLPTETDDK